MPSGVYKRTEVHKRKPTEETKLKMSLSQKGKPRPSSKNSPTAFKKDSIPWNKDTKGLMPEPPNKGKTNGITDYERRLGYIYGSTLEKYNQIKEEQNNCCAICRIHESKLTRKLCVDHDHATGKIRGLLCGHCNLGLGQVKDDIDILQKMKEYLGEKKSNIISKEEYLKKTMSGIRQISELIKPTFGGMGKNVIVESRLYPYHQVANDCETIIKAVNIIDKTEKISADFLKEISTKQDKMLGNGRKTTILMTDKLLQLGSGYNGDKNDLKRELDNLIPFIENEIDKQTTQITTKNIKFVAQTASENEQTGILLQEIYEKIGNSGIVQCESSGTYDTSYRLMDGICFDMAGMLSPYLAHNDKNKAIYEKPIILVTKKKITTDDDINPLLNEMADSGKKDLVIFTADMDAGVAQMLIELHKSKRFNICIIRVPTLWRDYYFEDFAKCTGATIIDESSGKTLKNMHLTDLGTCDKITVDTDETIVDSSVDISEHLSNLKTIGDDDSKLRLSWLNRKKAIVKLGANSETDLSLKLTKTYDAIRSSELALKFGIVKGGGLCLKEVSKSMPTTMAGVILKEVLQTPYNINIENGVKEIPDNIVDASMVVKASVRHAIGIASTILTASSLIYLPDEPMIKEQQNAFT